MPFTKKRPRPRPRTSTLRVAFISPTASFWSTSAGVSKVAVSHVMGLVVTPDSEVQVTLSPPEPLTFFVSPSAPATCVHSRSVKSTVPNITLPGAVLVMPLTPVDEKNEPLFLTPPPLSIPREVERSVNSAVPSALIRKSSVAIGTDIVVARPLWLSSHPVPTMLPFTKAVQAWAEADFNVRFVTEAAAAVAASMSAAVSSTE
mmetsp:Transcript_1243/g.3456  ORF Transcript_1243/g.3456 Transcript_1243/m.3456 type:complete len:203 (+) Transcript_1243:736-1344(+)